MKTVLAFILVYLAIIYTGVRLTDIDLQMSYACVIVILESTLSAMTVCSILSCELKTTQKMMKNPYKRDATCIPFVI